MINAIFLTGWLTAEPVMRVVPGSYEQRLYFDLHTRDSRGAELRMSCYIEAGPLLTRIEPILAPGRGLVIQGEYTQRRYLERDRLKWLIHEVRVTACQIPNRAKSAPSEAAAAAPAGGAAAMPPEVARALKEGVAE